MTLSDLVFLSVICLFILFIWQHLNISNQARLLAHKRCQESSLVLLDQSVILEKIRPCRSNHSLFAFKRCYRFEFSSVGDTRYRGEVVFIGARLQHIGFQPYKLP